MYLSFLGWGRSITDNNLHLASIVFGEVEHMYAERLILTMTGPLKLWHSSQNASLRSVQSTPPYEIQMLSGGFDEVYVSTLALLGNAAKLQYCGVSCDLGGLPLDESSDVHFQDEQCQLMARYCFAIVSARIKRLLVVTRGWPRQSVLMLRNNYLGQMTMLSLRQDWCTFEDLKSLAPTAPWAQQVVRRSVFQTRPAQQLALCSRAENWIVTDKLRKLLREKSNRCIATQVIEDGFRQARLAERQGTNQQVGASRLWGQLIDSKASQPCLPHCLLSLCTLVQRRSSVENQFGEDLKSLFASGTRSTTFPMQEFRLCPHAATAHCVSRAHGLSFSKRRLLSECSDLLSSLSRQVAHLALNVGLIL